MPRDDDLPDEFQSGGDGAPGEDKAPTMSPEERRVLLDALGTTLAGMRTKAIDARKASGIEGIWQACTEAYLGIDDMNRHEFGAAQWFKPSTINGNITQITKRNNTRSTAYVRLTSRYVDMGAAKISEITLPIDDKAFSIKATPVPDLIAKSEDQTPLTQHPVTGEVGAVKRPPVQGEQPGSDGMVQATVGDAARVTLQQADDKAKKAEKRIHDWMLEAKYPLEMRKVEHNAAKLGCGILKGPFPQVKASMARMGRKVARKTKLVPGMRSISPWNFYPQAGCGENVHDGDYVFECDDITETKLRRLKQERLTNGQPIYIADQIDKVIEEGPERCRVREVGTPTKNDEATHAQNYKIWYFTGTIGRKDMELMSAVLDDLPDDVAEINAIVTMVNDTPIRATVNPLESGSFGYRVHNWSPRDGFWAGVGVGEQLEMPQRTVNASTRALLNNAGLTAGGQIVLDRQQIEPSDGKWELVPNKVWWTKVDATGLEDIRKAFMSFKFPNMGAQLQAVIDYGFRLAEEASNIPLVTQGKESPNSPQTFGAAELQNTNAHTLLRSIAYGLDDSITEPLVTDLYEWLLLDEDVPEDEKGDFVIDAKGSIVLVERAIQTQIAGQLLPLSKDAAFGLNPKKVMETYLRGNRFKPSDMQYTDAELAEMAKQPPPEDPAITAAKIRAASTEKVAQGNQAVSVRKAELDTDRDTAYEHALTQRAVVAEEGKGRELGLKRELEILKMTNAAKIELDKVKAQLAETQMELAMQRELAQMTARAQQVADTDMEPAGRAPAGEAFQK